MITGERERLRANFLVDGTGRLHVPVVPEFKGEASSLTNSMCGVHSVVIFCRACSTCSTGRWADTAATVQPNRQTELLKQNKRKHPD